MNFDPYSRYNNPSQQPWSPVKNPGNSYGQGYNAPPISHFSTMPPYPSAAATMPEPSFLAALFSFPFVVLATYAWPVPATFARHKSAASWSVLVVLVALLTMVTGILAYVWGRLPTLDQGIEALSVNRVTPHPLSFALVITLAFAAPIFLLAWVTVLHYVAHTQQGQGSYRAQLYSTLVIETPLVLFLVIVALLLFVVPTLGSIARVPFVIIGILLSLYNLLLFVPSLMAIQGLSAEKALTCMISVVVIVLLLVAIVSILFESDGNASNNQQGGSSNRYRGNRRRRRERICPHCGFSLEVYDQLHRTALTQSCPRCGDPLA